MGTINKILQFKYLLYSTRKKREKNGWYFGT